MKSSVPIGTGTGTGCGAGAGAGCEDGEDSLLAANANA